MAANDRKRGRTWEKEETLVLLEKWGEENVQERLRECKRKKPTWEEISGYVKASGYEDREQESCKTRIHTLVSAYRTYKDQTTKTGTAAAKIPPFFNELEAILSDKPATRPLMVLNLANKQKENEPRNKDDEDDASIVEEEEEDEEGDDPDVQYPMLKKGLKRVKDTPSDDNKKKKKKRTSTQDVMVQIDDSIRQFIEYQQNADKDFLEMEKERERKENEREERRRKEDQEFFLKLARVLND